MEKSRKNRFPKEEHWASFSSVFCPRQIIINDKPLSLLIKTAYVIAFRLRPKFVQLYKRSPNLRDLLVRTKLRDCTKRQDKTPSGIYKCNHPRCLTCPFLQEGQNKYTFSATKEERHINDTLNCKSKNLIYLIECKKCAKQYIGETKRQRNERFGEHRCSILNHHHLINPTPVSTHFNQPGHSINDIVLIPLELIHNKRDSVRKAREAHLIDKAMTLDSHGINRRDEFN